MTKTAEDFMGPLGPYLDILDEIVREGHDRYMKDISPESRLPLGSRAQASFTYDHIVAAADRKLIDDKNILPKSIKGLKVWIFKSQDVVIRFKKMDKEGRSQSFQTKQQKNYDLGAELPELPSPPIRLTVGYLLDATGSQYLRTQIARPAGKAVDWCVALVPAFGREEGSSTWEDVTKQRRFA